jgi:uncharacterized membrane protein
MAISKNVGSIDRIIRGIAGVWMVMDGLKHKGSVVRQMEVFTGGSLIANALTGHCAMLSAFGVSTIPGKEDNLIDQLKAALPGNPILVQDFGPATEFPSLETEESMNKLAIV